VLDIFVIAVACIRRVERGQTSSPDFQNTPIFFLLHSSGSFQVQLLDTTITITTSVWNRSERPCGRDKVSSSVRVAKENSRGAQEESVGRKKGLAGKTDRVHFFQIDWHTLHTRSRKPASLRSLFLVAFTGSLEPKSDTCSDDEPAEPSLWSIVPQSSSVV
jgi:hypothetical protein